MLIITDGVQRGVSGTFPLPYLFLSKIVFFEHRRRSRLLAAFIGIEILMCAAFMFLMLTDRKVAILTSFSIGYPALLTVLKVLTQRTFTVPRSRVRFVGVAPVAFWAEHLLLCAAFGLGGLWANQMQGLPYFFPNIVTVFTMLALVAAAWPFANLLVCRKLHGSLR